jgi:hypothetical protein
MEQIEMKYTVYFYIGQGYSGLRCGPWASCFYYTEDFILRVEDAYGRTLMNTFAIYGARFSALFGDVFIHFPEY